MKVSKKAILFVLMAVVGLAAMSLAYAQSDSETITADVTVPEVCIVSLNTTTISFGEVSPGTDTGETNEVVTITNDGNVQATETTIEGTDWDDGVNTMAIGQTVWNTADEDYELGESLTDTAESIIGGDLTAGASLDVFFGVAVPEQQPPGTYEQDITITMNC